MAAWNYGDPVCLERCMTAARSVTALTMITKLGHRHFMSQRIGATYLHGKSPVDVDGFAHPQMWHPALEALWYSRNPRLEKTLRQWADGWLAHMKPGEYVTRVDVKQEKALDKTWRALAGGYGGEGSAFAFLGWITRNQRYVDPFLYCFSKNNVFTSPKRLPTEFLHYWNAPETRKMLTYLRRQSDRYWHTGVAISVLTGDKTPAIAALKEDIAEMQTFPVMYTTSEPFTDRVFLTAINNATMVYTGGYATRNKFNRSHAVSWSGFGTDYAAFVLRASPTHFKALLYNFSDKPMTGAARFWSLDHGEYALRVGPDANGDDQMDRVTSQRRLEIIRGAPVSLTLPPRKTLVFELEQKRPLDDLRKRPDLALSPLDTEIADGALRGFAHSIGARPTPATRIVLLDPKGHVRADVAIPSLDPPLDLKTRKAPYKLRGLPKNHEGWAVIVDPENDVKELCETNNRLILHETKQ